MINYLYIFLLFLVYAILGWILEVINAYIKLNKFVNRGFLIGPYCPIYGVGMLIIIYSLYNYMDNPLVVFILAMFICMVLEYMTSYIMEKLFNARWWDYSNQKFNINGRICLETAIPFGLGGLFIMYIVNPIIVNLLNKLSNNALLIVGFICLVIFVSDLVISFITILNVRNVDISKFKDDTEDMNKRVKAYLLNHSILTRRLIKSFPNAKLKFKNIKKKIESKIKEFDM